MTTAAEAVDAGVRVDVGGRVWTVTLSRPERANALDDAMARALLAAVDDATAGDARALVLRSTGRAFCAGFDMGDLPEASDGDLALRFLRVGELLEALYAAPFVTVACAAGPAVGAGADLVAACDHRLLEPAARLGFPGAAFGIVLGSRRLAGLVGVPAAADLVSSGRRVDADEAVRIGLGTELVEEGAGAVRAADLVADLCRLDPQTHRHAMRAMRPEPAGRGLADLATSLARNPGLADRVRAYRQAQQSAGTRTR